MIVGVALTSMEEIALHVWDFNTKVVEQQCVSNAPPMEKLVVDGCVTIGSRFTGSVEQPVMCGRSIVGLIMDSAASFPTLSIAHLAAMGSSLGSLGASTSDGRVKQVVRKMDKESLWKDFFNNPGDWRDYRPKKARRDELSPNFPDLKHNSNSKWSLWAGGAYGNPFKWVQAKLESDKYQFVDPDNITLDQMLPAKRPKASTDSNSPM